MRRIAMLLSGVFLIPSRTLAQSVDVPNHVVQTHVSGLAGPTAMAFVGPDDILVHQKHDGRVRRVIGGVLQGAPVLDVAVNDMSERGLLGMALDPDFVNNAHVYMFYTEAPSDTATPIANRVYRYSWNGSALVAPQLVLDLPVTPSTRHVGGWMLFGPDDKLYTVIGDLDRLGKLQNIASGADPDDTSVILRTNADGSAPPDNPFYDASNPLAPLHRYYAYGVRNSFGMAFDPLTGVLWNTENGPFDYDEVNRVDPGTNSGWNQIMGPDARDSQGPGDLWVAPGSFYSDPEFSWSATVGPTSIAFVQSPKLGCGQLHDVLVGDANCGQLYRFGLTPGRAAFDFTSPELADLVADNAADRCTVEQEEILFGAGFNTVTDIETGPDGLLYVLSYGDGKIYRIVPMLPAPDDPDGDGVDSACDCGPSEESAYADPAEVPRLRLSGKSPTRIGWDAQNAAAGPGTSYTVVTGDVSDLRVDLGFASSCRLALGLSAPRLEDARVPLSGSAFYYLARASNACGDGTFGDGSGSPDPRDLLDAPAPPPCP